MKKMRWLVVAVAAVAGVGLYGTRARAADHTDGAASVADPTSDITDVYAWVDQNDPTKLNLIMNVFPFADTSSLFSNQVKYVFHVNSRNGLLTPADAEKDIICTFDTSSPQLASCWLLTAGATTADDYATGDATDPNFPLFSSNGHFQVFTGLRDDPFFFNLDAFKSVVATTTAAIPSLVAASAIDPAGCPQLDYGTASTLVGELSVNPADGGAPIDHFAGANVMSIVVQADISSLTSGGDTLLSVWGSTNN